MTNKEVVEPSIGEELLTDVHVLLEDLDPLVVDEEVVVELETRPPLREELLIVQERPSGVLDIELVMLPALNAPTIDPDINALVELDKDERKEVLPWLKDELQVSDLRVVEP